MTDLPTCYRTYNIIPANARAENNCGDCPHLFACAKQSIIMPLPSCFKTFHTTSPTARAEIGCGNCPHLIACSKQSVIMAYFTYIHLPPHLRVVSMRVCELAAYMDASLPDSAEKSAGLRKLLEAKDCFVRANMVAPKQENINACAACGFDIRPSEEFWWEGRCFCSNVCRVEMEKK